MINLGSRVYTFDLRGDICFSLKRKILKLIKELNVLAVAIRRYLLDVSGRYVFMRLGG